MTWMNCNLLRRWMLCLMTMTALTSLMASAQVLNQVLNNEELKKVAPSAFFFAGQSAATQARNTVGLKTPDGKLVLAGLVDTSGYSTAIAEKYQGFLITESKINFAGSVLEPGQYGFGFKDGKFTVMNVASTDLLSVASQNDDQVQHPVPLKLVRDGTAYRLYAGRKYIVVKTE